MFGLLEPMLIGAGVGALGSLITGGSPLKGAAMGGALGGGGAAIKGMMPASFGLEGAKVAESASAASAGGNMLAPTLPEVGMANSFNMATNAPLPAVAGAGTAPLMTSASPEMGGMMASNSGVPMAGGGFNLSEAFTPQNMLGAASLASQGGGQQQPQISAQGGGISKGQAPSMDAISSLLATTKIPQRQKRMNLFA